MPRDPFRTNPYKLHELLQDCNDGKLQLPDFQRSWVWDEDRIKSLLASISKSYPVGALMTLEVGDAVVFKPRSIEGAPPEAATRRPRALLLDGQQRLTSLYQVTLRGEVVKTVTPKKKQVLRWFYLDLKKAHDSTVDRDEAIVSVPEDRIVRASFGRDIELDLSTRENEYEREMFPLTDVFDFDRWQDGFYKYWRDRNREDVVARYIEVKRAAIEPFKFYAIPVITLDETTSKEAVCVVFEKVNTGGKPLDAFELVTAMYAASNHELRKDWFGAPGHPGRHERFKDALRLADAEAGVLGGVSNTDFLQAASLFHTRQRRAEAESKGRQGKELPAVTGNRQALLNLPLDAYLKYQGPAEDGFLKAAKFLHRLHVYRLYDLPYQSQLVALATILADVGTLAEHDAARKRLEQWYWAGVFGELYGSAIDTRVAKDFVEVPAWLRGGSVPSTLLDGTFRFDRLKTMRMRLSAAYKGVNALLMKEGAMDFRSGQKFDHAVFFGESVDIHHIFPQAWCKARGIPAALYDSIINKTPLSYRTNRIIGGEAPSRYLRTLEEGAGSNSIPASRLDEYLESHLIDPALLRADNFDAFMADRQKRLATLIEGATGVSIFVGGSSEEGGADLEGDDDMVEAALVLDASRA